MQKTLTKILTLLFLITVSPLQAGATIADRIEDTENRLDTVTRNLETKRTDLLSTESKISSIQQELAPLRQRIYTLEGQLENIQNLTTTTERKIANVEEQIKQKELELGQVLESSEAFLLQFESEKRNLRLYTSMLYSIERNLYNYETKEINPFKLLLAQGSVSDTARSLNYLHITQNAEQQILTQLDNTYEIYRIHQQEIDQKRLELSQLQEELYGEKQDLTAQQEAQELLLSETRGEESVYQELLAEAIRQQEESSSLVSQLSSNSRYLTSRLAALEKYRQELGDNGTLVQDTGVAYSDLDAINALLGEKHQSFIWPVDPSRGITAYFHDPSYASYFGVRHDAIDIRAYQETEITAPADAVVYKVRDNGYGYSYLILAHNDNLLTVYGHITEFLVSEGDLILQGQPIALSGGMPGTVGAGTMTTGPHLHFEVYDNGTHVDPLDYLPIFDLPAEYIPDKYFEELKDIDFAEEASQKNKTSVE